MKIRVCIKSLSICITLVCLLMSCTRQSTFPSILKAPDYSDSLMWYINVSDTVNPSADIFYICSTETRDWNDMSGKAVHFADVFNTYHRAALYSEMKGVNERISNLNFYSPYYRQATLDGLLTDTACFVSRSMTAFEDVSRAFSCYIQHYNNGRPFVLMGYSQGAFDVIRLLHTMSDSLYNRMVAAYVIGYKVTEEDLGCRYIVPATKADDTGVTVCFNSVLSPECAIHVISGNTAIGINPVNWTTEATPARFADTLVAEIDTISHLVCVSGYNEDMILLPYVGKEGNYHTKEIVFYGEQLNENVLLRTQKWVETHTK